MWTSQSVSIPGVANPPFTDNGTTKAVTIRTNISLTADARLQVTNAQAHPGAGSLGQRDVSESRAVSSDRRVGAADRYSGLVLLQIATMCDEREGGPGDRRGPGSTNP